MPAVVYGYGIEPQNLSVKYLDLERMYQRAGESTLIDLQINEAEPAKVLISEIQTDSVTDRYLHVDFNQIRMDKKLTADIPLKFVGESEAVKSLGGILETSLQTVEVECLPKDLVSEIEVDLSPLKTFDDIIYVKDLKVPAGLEIINDPKNAVALVVEPREEEPEPVPEAIEGEEGEAVEGEEGEKKEGEEPAEGGKKEAGGEGKLEEAKKE